MLWQTADAVGARHLGRWHHCGVRTITIDGDMIRLGQFLKLAGVIESGGETKFLLANGEVRVNGEVDTRRGRQLRHGDVVSVGREELRVG
jgi:ribosome-associated protein